MLQLRRIQELIALHRPALPWWVPESIEGMAERIDELEHILVGMTADNDEMYDALRFYAGEPNGDRARRITER